MAINTNIKSLNMSGIKGIVSDFKTGREDVLKSIAGTTASSVETLTEFRSAIANSINGTLKELTGNILSTQDLLSFVDYRNGKLEINQNAIARTIAKETGIDINADGGIEGMADQIYNDINRYSEGALGKIYNKNGELVLLDSMMTGTEYAKLTGMVDDYLSHNGKDRDNGYYDRYTNSTIGKGLIRQAAVSGNYVDVQSLYDTADDIDKPGYADTLAICLKDVGNNGDFRTAAVITDIIGVERTQAVLPGLLVLLFRNYRLPTYIKLEEYDEEGNRLVSYGDLIQPGWRNMVYHDTETTNLMLWTNTSAGLHTLFLRSKRYAADMIMGRSYRQSDTSTLMKEKYPTIPTVTLG